MLVSIIVPIYNAQKFLKKCINSLLNQTYKNIEIILVNDGSTDDSLEICEYYAKKDKRIKVMDKVNGGVSSARNIGIEASTGTYICFIDSDDYINKNFVKEAVKIFEKNSVDLVKFNYVKKGKVIKIKNKMLLPINEIIPTKGNIIKKYIFLTDNLCTSCANMYKTSVVKSLKFNSDFRIGEDFLFVSQYLNNTESLYVLNKPYYYYKVNANSATHSFDIKKNIEKTQEAILANREIEKIIFNKFEIKNNPRLIKSKRNIMSYVYASIENNNYQNYKISIEKFFDNNLLRDEYEKMMKLLTKDEIMLVNSNTKKFWIYKIKLKLKNIARNIL